MSDYLSHQNVPTLRQQIESLVEDRIKKKQDTLISGETIKTINGDNLLGKGNISTPQVASSLIFKVGSTMALDSTYKTVYEFNIPVNGYYLAILQYQVSFNQDIQLNMHFTTSTGGTIGLLAQYLTPIGTANAKTYSSVSLFSTTSTELTGLAFREASGTSSVPGTSLNWALLLIKFSE